MKTKQIPAIVMLLGGLVYCIIGFKQQLPAGEFLKQLLLILVIFFMVGEIAKAVLDPFFKEEEKEETQPETEETEQDASDGEEKKQSEDGDGVEEKEQQTEE